MIYWKIAEISIAIFDLTNLVLRQLYLWALTKPFAWNNKHGVLDLLNKQALWYLTFPLGRVTVNGLEKCLSVCLSVCPTLLYRKNWTLLYFHTWHVSLLRSDKNEHSLSIFSTILEAIKKGKKRARKLLGVASFSLPDSNEARVLHHWLS